MLHSRSGDPGHALASLLSGHVPGFSLHFVFLPTKICFRLFLSAISVQARIPLCSFFCRLPPLDLITSIIMAQNQQSRLKACFLPSHITDWMFREMFCLAPGFEDCNLVRFTQHTCGGDRRTIGDCVGLGFVHFRSREDLDRALAFFERAREHFGHGILIDHKDVKVDVALPPTPDYCVKVVVFGIPDRWTDRELVAHFQAFGIVEHAGIDSNRRGHIIFHHRTSAEAAVLSSQNNTVAADGTVLRLRIHLASNLA